MEFIWSRSDEDNLAHRSFWKSIQEIFGEEEGLCYYKFPIYMFNEGKKEQDFLILHKELGLFVIGFRDYIIDDLEVVTDRLWKIRNRDIIDDQVIIELEDQLFFLLHKFATNSKLRKGTKQLISSKTVLVLPFISRNEWKKKNFSISREVETHIFFTEDLEPQNLYNKFHEISQIAEQQTLNEDQWIIAQGILKGVPVIQKQLRKITSNKNNKSKMLHEVEKQLITIDRDQNKTAIEIPNGPQRIRGLAGSGKTVVLCMKAAWMHLRYPEWKIVYTFYTRSLYNMVKKLITRFYRYWNDVDPNWENIHILHGWGSQNAPGLYHKVSTEMGEKPRTYTESLNLFKFKETNELLGQCCRELMIIRKNIPSIYDAILIDEAQDFHFEFFKLCFKILKEPIRLIWAYDDVQSMESLSVPTTEDIFGLNSDGSLIVDLEGFYMPGSIEKDVILYRCYRTPRPILVAAHIFGMGLLRKEGAVQFIPSLGGWEDIGYEIQSGLFTTGNSVTLRRPKENSPHLLEDLVGYGNVIHFNEFNSRSEELKWVAEKIVNIINEDDLKPEEILVISMDWRHMNSQLEFLQFVLEEQNINSIIPGVDTTSDIFQTENHVTLTGVYRAKGNEASVVFVVAFDEVHKNPNLVVQERNQAFTALTRTRGWCYLTGIGQEASDLFSEIKRIIKTEEFTFVVPDMKQIQRNLDNLEYERKRKKRSRALKIMNELENILIAIDDPELSEDFAKRLKKTKE